MTDEDDDAEDIVDYSRGDDAGADLGVEFAGLSERRDCDADRGGGQDYAVEQALHRDRHRETREAAVTEHRDDEAETHRADNSGGRYDHSGSADLLDLREVGLDTGGEHYQDDADLRDEPETGHSGVGQDDLTGNVFDETDDHSGKEHSDDSRELDARAELHEDL